jgi:hypothetical protein
VLFKHANSLQKLLFAGSFAMTLKNNIFHAVGVAKKCLGYRPPSSVASSSGVVIAPSGPVSVSPATALCQSVGAYSLSHGGGAGGVVSTTQSVDQVL